MGTTCSSCCWSDRGASDVANGALQEKLLTDDHVDPHDDIIHSTMVEDSDGNPYPRSEEFRKQKTGWPRPATTPASTYGDAYGDDSDSDDEHRASEQSASTHSCPDHTWDLKEGGGDHAEDDQATSESLADDDAEGSALPSDSLRLDRALSAPQSVRSSVSDSYASIRELPTYESLLFADDAAARASVRDSDGSADNEDEIEEATASGRFSSSPTSFVRISGDSSSTSDRKTSD